MCFIVTFCSRKAGLSHLKRKNCTSLFILLTCQVCKVGWSETNFVFWSVETILPISFFTLSFDLKKKRTKDGVSFVRFFKLRIAKIDFISLGSKIVISIWLWGQIHCLAKTWIYLTPYVCNKRIFDSRTFMHHKIFKKTTYIEVGSSHIYASFGTFCVQIGQLFEAQCVFEKCMKTVKSLFSKESDVFFELLQKFKVSLRLD